MLQLLLRSDIFLSIKEIKNIVSVTNNIITFKRPIDYRDVTYLSHPNNLGFGLYKHKVDQRTLAA